MDRATLFKAATRLLRILLQLLVISLAPAFALAAPPQAPSVADPRPQLQRTEPSVTVVSPPPGPVRDALARAAPAGEPPRPSAALPHTAGDASNSTMLTFLLAGAVILALVAVTTAILLAKTQTKLEAEKSHREAIEKDFNALYNLAPLGYHTLDLNGVVVDMNDTEIKWLGYSRDEIIGKRYGEFLDGTSWTAFSESYGRLLHGDRFDQIEQKYRIISKDGSARSLSLTPSLVRGHDGRVVETRWAAADISETVRLEQALDTEAHFDRVTNAHNRAFFFTLGEREVARARRVGAPLTLLYVDIEGFTRINSIYGHFAGDKVLRAVCGVIAQALRNVDVFARVGDDEFAILLPDTALAGAIIVAERLKASIASTPVNLSSDDYVEVRAEVGLGEYSASTPDLDSLLTAGEKALERERRARRQAPGQPEELVKEAHSIETPAT